MGLVFLTFSFLGYLIFLIRYSKWSTTSMPLFIISTGILVLFCSGFFGLLLPVAWCLNGLGVVLGIISLYRTQNNLKLFVRLLEPGPVVFLLSACFFYVKVSYHGSFAIWDEFSHWGFAAKEMFFQNSFTTVGSALLLKSYPPGTALFQYWLMKFVGWSEGNAYWAQDLLILSAVVAILERLVWRQWVQILVTLSVAFLLVFIFGYGLKSLYVDNVLGVLCGASIVSSVRSKTSISVTIARILPTLFILPLVKAVGVMLGIFAAIIIICDQIFKDKSIISFNSLIKKKIIFCTLSILAFLAPIVSSQAWGWYAKKSGFNVIFKTSFSLLQIEKSFSSNEATERDKITIDNFKKAIKSYKINPDSVFHGGVSERLGYTLTVRDSFFFLVFLSIGALVNESRRRERWRAVIGLLLIFVCFVVYTFGLLLMYLYSFGDYEGPRLASFDRYMGIIFIVWALVVWGFLFQVISKKRKYYSYILQSIAFICMLSLSPARAAGFIFFTPKTLPLRTEIRTLLSNVTPNIGDDKKVYIVWQNTTGLEPWILAYELLPRITSTRSMGWSLGRPYYPGDIWTSDWTLQEWSDRLASYDFLLLASVDSHFWERYYSLFKVSPNLKNEKLFRIIKGNKKVELEAVRNLEFKN
ncbi:hypothetical protein [Leptospira santarosai]|uniref:hypothetical protein n=1 Tax=Leptospira santarosai TaxID=28183 RepID=UPI0005193EA3|nr:hypothetical protein [Leptospira santarosai]MDI7205191.1 hypothetical protein [Leptospira santarosai]